MMMGFTIRVPASSANLGVGFDVLGIALNLWLEIQVQVLSQVEQQNQPYVTIEYEGVDSKQVALDVSNPVIQAALHLIARVKLSKPEPSSDEVPVYSDPSIFPNPLKIKMKNEIPLARGLGSSASALVCGVLLANTLCSMNLSKDELMGYLLELENHPDNISPSLYGGLCVGYVRSEEERSMLDSDRKCGIMKLKWNEFIKAVVIIPEFELCTSTARSVLPNQYKRKDAIFQLQRVSMLVTLFSQYSVTKTRDELHSTKQYFHDSVQDIFHQPYRQHLVPGLKEILLNLNPNNTAGLLGVVLSGAGPTILALSFDNYDDIMKKIQAILLQKEIQSTGKVLEVVEDGAFATF